MGPRTSGSALRRFTTPDADPAISAALRPDHTAAVKGRSIFPGRVMMVDDGPRLLVSGINNAKIGKVVTKGPWAGMPIYTLTLEERATCPRSCAQWLTCYGSSMNWPSRWDHTDPLFMDTLRAEIVTLCRSNPKGVVVRLHVLGDFYSIPYVKMWTEMVDRFAQLHVYGYTARREDADDDESRLIAKALRWLTETAPDQFAMRFSRAEPGAGRAIVVEADPELPDVIVCPAQTHATETCGTCGLCWSPAARGKTIAFLRHGMKRRGPNLVEAPAKPDRRKYRGTMASFRTSIGALPGEDKLARDTRVRTYVREHPELTYASISEALGVPIHVANKMGLLLAEKRQRGRKSSFTPPQIFTPSAVPKGTPEERIAAIPEADLASIAARYGALIKRSAA